jgi:hypothetical protein
MGLPKLIFRTVNKYFKGLEKRCQSLVTVTVTYIKRKINCINFGELGEHDTNNEIFFLKIEVM